MSDDQKVADELLDSKSERPKGHILRKPRKPTVKEKNKAETQQKAIKHDTGR
jgi:hypothetical protein